MTTVQVTLSDDEVEMFTEQARREGLQIEDWLRAAGYGRLAAKPMFDRQLKPRKPMTPEESKEFWATREEFWAAHSNLDGPEREPDWEEHKRVINDRFERFEPT